MPSRNARLQAHNQFGETSKKSKSVSGGLACRKFVTTHKWYKSARSIYSHRPVPCQWQKYDQFNGGSDDANEPKSKPRRGIIWCLSHLIGNPSHCGVQLLTQNIRDGEDISCLFNTSGVHFIGGGNMRISWVGLEETRAGTEVVEWVPVFDPQIPGDRGWIGDIARYESSDIGVERRADFIIVWETQWWSIELKNTNERDS